jgi:hypothetical protein
MTAGHGDVDAVTGLTEPTTLRSFVPEDSYLFRCARLLLLLATARKDGRPVVSLDRLSFYDFFADNPWIVVNGDAASDVADRDTLVIAGFSQTQLSYASTGQRFVSRRERLRTDLSLLVSYGLVGLKDAEFVITDPGQDFADGLQSSYADSFRASASVVLRRLVRLPNRTLEREVENWLGHSWLLLDLLDDVRGADVPIATAGNEKETD